jgi:hypothetical protein
VLDGSRLARIDYAAANGPRRRLRHWLAASRRDEKRSIELRDLNHLSPPCCACSASANRASVRTQVLNRRRRRAET